LLDARRDWCRRSWVQSLQARRLAVLAVLSQQEVTGSEPNATDPEPSGYRVMVAWPWGVTFERWVTELDAMEDLQRVELGAAASLHVRGPPIGSLVPVAAASSTERARRSE
jgi:hypothetical protein